ncbi:MAG: hypothetical protein IIZ13_06675 [Renibacterium sp.]|nr:hypothetical protein [Renibacterium sp.]
MNISVPPEGSLEEEDFDNLVSHLAAFSKDAECHFHFAFTFEIPEDPKDQPVYRAPLAGLPELFRTDPGHPGLEAAVAADIGRRRGNFCGVGQDRRRESAQADYRCLAETVSCRSENLRA